ncbi:transmembrane protein, putative (macronuclear) [Tetrahymena thermophila SB210]|uniref:Transmembrane protein, putative n=1 Tax=Tetrahymena thermophila (strain SB210) TaxID=312017 RepID=W7XI52_TETTS|nr:transmembrane protein, putative [Tetrahymena thermophila SB210]EWS74321.1 transmembrane protein, putative [Tetrahymena thermophila SB210]|eukprot:XP_012653142.1 transmembrane protein, putative [Tetrahymena thermophila SB210]
MNKQPWYQNYFMYIMDEQYQNCQSCYFHYCQLNIQLIQFRFRSLFKYQITYLQVFQCLIILVLSFFHCFFYLCFSQNFYSTMEMENLQLSDLKYFKWFQIFDINWLKTHNSTNNSNCFSFLYQISTGNYPI